MSDVRDLSRFMALSRRGGPHACWEWIGTRNTRRGKQWHGTFYAANKRGREWAHRFAWKAFRGEIPNGMVVHHCCENPGCVNPAHLQLMTFSAHSSMHAKASSARLRPPPTDGKVFAECRGFQVVRYERAGKWFVNPLGVERGDQITVSEAVTRAMVARALGGEIHRGLPGGKRFDYELSQAGA